MNKCILIRVGFIFSFPEVCASNVDYAQEEDALPMISDNPLVLLFKFDEFQFGIKKNTSL